jgi:tripartite-type tricarboxylate transporter receptor subunit TctC
MTTLEPRAFNGRKTFRLNTMGLPRRKFLRLAAGASALATVSRLAWADTYPSRPVRMLVGFPPGGPTDIIARLIGPWLSQRLGQPFVVENRPGAASSIAAEEVVRSPPDGYTLFLESAPNVTNTTLYPNLHFNFLRDIAPVASVMRTPIVMVVNESVPVRTVPDFIAYAKTRPGKISFASPGIGTTSHLAGELFKLMAGVDMVHVPYRGSMAAITDLLGGQVQVQFDTPLTLVEYIRVGKLRALAVTTASRAEALPEVPAMGGFLPGYEASAWFGFGAPKDTSAEIIGRLNKEINAALADANIKARFADLGATVFVQTPKEFGKFLTDETDKWAKVIQTANIQPE